jgi:hypothetical protein
MKRTNVSQFSWKATECQVWKYKEVTEKEDEGCIIMNKKCEKYKGRI